MEHIIQFAVSIDDDAIERKILENAAKECTMQIKDKMRNTFFDDRGWNGGFKEEGKLVIKEWLDLYKDEIIDEAVKKIAMSVRNSKAFKEKYGEVIE